MGQCAAAIVEQFTPDALKQTPKPHLVGLSREELQDVLKAMGFPAFRAKQLWHWIYWQGVTDFDAMQNLPAAMRDALAEQFTLARPSESVAQISTDGTRKWLLRYDDANEAETVYIPDVDDARGAVCVSSQVGCTLTCSFCHTGTQKLVRNLTASEIVQQFMIVRDAMGEWPTPTGPEGNRLVSNIVMMGMGEPLYNYDNVAKALKIIMDGEGISLSKRRITLSTSGVVPKIHQCGEELGVNLAISLHAVNDELRNVLVPINKKYPIKELMQACRDYPVGQKRRITFEYVMLDGVNDSEADARELVRMLKGIPAKVNLIPFNPWPGSDYTCSPKSRIQRFSDLIFDAGIAAPIRTPRGRDILAACGQLKSDSERKKGEKVRL